jgi:hypothetical protein
MNILLNQQTSLVEPFSQEELIYSSCTSVDEDYNDANDPIEQKLDDINDTLRRTRSHLLKLDSIFVKFKRYKLRRSSSLNDLSFKNDDIAHFETEINVYDDENIQAYLHRSNSVEAVNSDGESELDSDLGKHNFILF